MNTSKIKPGDDTHLTSLMAPQGVPVGEIVLFGGDLKEVSWAAGKMPLPGTKLYAGAAPAAVAGPAWDKTRDSLATLLLGLARRPFLDFDVACIALDAATEPGMPLAYMRGAPAAPALEAPAAVDGDQLDSLARKKLGALLNAFGEAQWQAGRGVPCPSIEDAFEAVISAAVALLAAAPQAPAQEAPAAPAPAVPDGWRLVPANPTDAMLGAAQKAWLADPLRRSSTVYAAALAAAPQAPAAPVGGNWIAADDVRRLVRELDVALHGEADAAPQASLCDIVGLTKAAASKLGRPVLVAPAEPEMDARDISASRPLVVILENANRGAKWTASSNRSRCLVVGQRSAEEALRRALVDAGAQAAPAAPAVDAKAHDWRENASYGGEICAECGAAKGSRRGNAPCAWPPEPLDVCTDPYNCARCKTHPAHRGDMHHAGISRIGGSA